MKSLSCWGRLVSGPFGLGEPTHYDRPLALIAELRIVYSDGSVETICTDESWQYRRSFTTLSDIYNGETQDHTRPLGDWQSAVVIGAPGKLCERYSRRCIIGNPFR